MTKSVLILGASGRFGRNAALAFETAGWTVHRFQRTHDDLADMASNMDVIVNAWNPAYPDWARTVPQLTTRLLDAAQGTGATIVIPGNVYVYGPASPSPWSENSAHRATNPLGRVRQDMEAQYRQSGVRTLVLRGGDFLDTEASGNWFDRIMVKSLNRGVLTYPGNPGADHAWAYLPDMARACVQLTDQRESLPTFCDVPFPGYTLSAQAMAEMVAELLERPVRVKRMSWLPIRLTGPVWPMGRHLAEMRYLWSLPHQLDGTAFGRLLPDFQITPVQTALANALQGAGFTVRSTQTSR